MYVAEINASFQPWKYHVIVTISLSHIFTEQDFEAHAKENFGFDFNIEVLAVCKTDWVAYLEIPAFLSVSVRAEWLSKEK